MVLTVEFRDHAHAPWKRSRASWSLEDITWLNRACGYEKYRVARITA